MSQEFEFERPILELEKRLADLQALSEDGQIDLSREIKAISSKIGTMKAEIFRTIEPWQAAQIARHIQRPSTVDYLKVICGESFVETHGDRLYGDDPAMVCGFGMIDGSQPAAFIGHQKGHDTEENIYRNFGMPHPEGYRKAMRTMKLAEKFNRPIVIFIDTPGAFPGIGAEERGQSQAIAFNLREMSRIRVPILCIIIGEGGSGGALAVGIGDRMFMLEYSIYSVITAEGCAAILWKDAGKSKEAALALKIRAQDLKRFGIVDGIIPEPTGGAHRNHEQVIESVSQVIRKQIPELMALSPETLVEKRYQRFRNIGEYKIQQDLDNG